MLVVVYRLLGQPIGPIVKGHAVQEECWEQVDVWLYRGWCPLQDLGLTT